jgi:hypothetical protein
MAKTFKTAAAFKTSLEAHLRNTAQSRGLPFTTMQLKFVLERLLARLFFNESAAWLLKGGFAMDMRFRPKARMTKDIDLSVSLQTTDGRATSLTEVWDLLQEAMAHDLGDYLVYRVAMPKRELTNAPGGGGRFPCEALLAGKSYAKMHIDVGLGDAVLGKPDQLVGDDLLAFAGIPPAKAKAISQAQQFAEKIHAYTFPWGDRVNTRTKDLVDLVLLIERGQLDPKKVQEALEATFARRNTHPLPIELSSPPESWKTDFTQMASEAGISTSTIEPAFSSLTTYWKAKQLGRSV